MKRKAKGSGEMADELTRQMLERIMRLERRVDELGQPEVGAQWEYLTTPLTAGAFDGDAFSDTAKTLVDLSAVFGAPAGIRAALCFLAIRDSGSAGAACWMAISPVNAVNVGPGLLLASGVNDRLTYGLFAVPCDVNGDLYYQVEASGAGTMDVWWEIWGWAK